jgi:hypothetical protein
MLQAAAPPSLKMNASLVGGKAEQSAGGSA